MDHKDSLYCILRVLEFRNVSLPLRRRKSQHHLGTETPFNGNRHSAANTVRYCLVFETPKLRSSTSRPIVDRPGKHIHATLGFCDHRIDDRVAAAEVNVLPFLWVGVECLNIIALGLQIRKTLKP